MDLRPVDFSHTSEARARHLSWWLGLSVLGLALANLVVGWGGGVTLLTRGGATMSAMVPETSLGLGFLALAQMMVVCRTPLPRLARSLAFAVPLAAVFYVVATQAAVAGSTDRMSVATVLLMCLVGGGGGQSRQAAAIGAWAGGWCPCDFDWWGRELPLRY